MDEPRWTLDELAERVDVALAVDYAGPPSARVRAVPDRRAIRWYTTIGLIDRPVAHRGRTALYGPRHLLQLVAVKRLQASGLPLVAIQQELAGATDTQLARVARLPGGPAALDGGGSSRSATPAEEAAPADGGVPGGATGRAAARAATARRLPNSPWRVRLGRSPVARGGPGSGGEQAATFTAVPGAADRLPGPGSAGCDPAGGAAGGRGDPAAGTGAAGGCGGRPSRPRRRPAAAGRAPGTGARPADRIRTRTGPGRVRPTRRSRARRPAGPNPEGSTHDLVSAAADRRRAGGGRRRPGLGRSRPSAATCRSRRSTSTRPSPGSWPGSRSPRRSATRTTSRSRRPTSSRCRTGRP